ncbi:phosphoenolpyruvate synthase [Thiomicrospira sp. WB1]|uniref:phosphoenolpyruvate synthase n=1 Tax=Thiomicrospira sp. WB1 TaxID=1685380 RepID=UPI000A9BE615|nr:phosphoenolpyruvate synthase [Thiomicrospira sp. WB1]
MRYIRFFNEIGIHDIPLVGGKNASLGEMFQALTPKGIPVPDGFAITAEAYRKLLTDNDLWDFLHTQLDTLDADNVTELGERTHAIREAIIEAEWPEVLKREIHQAWSELNQRFEGEITLAVRSSATAEDLPDASFAGQQETYLNISGYEALVEACKRCFASLFTDRATHYRIDKGFDHFQVGLSIGVQKMVRSDLASSGVMFTLDTESGFDQVVFITGAWGLGENVVQGAVDPDEFYVHKPTFEQGFRHVLRRHLGAKKLKMIYDTSGLKKSPVKNIQTRVEERRRFCLSDDEVLKLADFAMRIEQHYSVDQKAAKAMDIEWAKDGVDGQLYIVQARPETVRSLQNHQCLTQFQIHPRSDAQVLTSGRAVGDRLAVGRVKIIEDVAEISQFEPGNILVTDMTTPDWEPIMKKAAAIVTNRGGRTCHAAIIARELGIPAIVGCGKATTDLMPVDTQTVTVSCVEGDTGKVYADEQPFEKIETDLSELGTTETDLMLNLANPDMAFSHRFLPSAGVGLARMEFMINESIKIHPLALIKPEAIKDEATQKEIVDILSQAGFDQNEGEAFFIQRLSEGIATLCAAFYPRPVVLRLSDFKSNEYRSLLGGPAFEPREENPMLGFRGVARYVSESFAPAFAMECAAIKAVREDFGLTNLKVMLPFVRTVTEAQQALKVMADNGLPRHHNGLEVYMMCEIPNNVLQMKAFAPFFDGISIGSNDLTQLVLGVDRDSGQVAGSFDEREAGVKTMIQMAIETAKQCGLHTGFCGQAPSDYPEMAAFLVEQGIDSISLNPDSLLKTQQRLLAMEQGDADS